MMNPVSWQRLGRVGLVRWFVIGWAGVLAALLVAAVIWLVLRLAVLAFLVAVPLVAAVAAGKAVRNWIRRRDAQRRGHERVEVSRVYP
jgi:hypothetical protein